MNIVIVGAGSVGQYIATILSAENHNIILIDPNKKRLEAIAEKTDIATRIGSGTDWDLLDELLELSPHFFISLTSDDEVNLCACSIAKHLGYPRTVARVRDSQFLNSTRLDFARIFNVDFFISPELLAAHEIYKYLLNPGVLGLETFAHGAVEMRTMEIPANWRRGDKPIRQSGLPDGVVAGLIYRDQEEKEKKIIFPHGNDHILPKDIVTFIGTPSLMEDLEHFLNIPQNAVKSVVIIGGSLTGINLAKILLEHGIDVRIIEKDYDRCCFLAEHLPDCTILHHDAADQNFLKSEKIGVDDVIIACTKNDETNILTAALGKREGCEKSIVLMHNPSYKAIAEKLSIDHQIFPREIVANHILSQLYSGKVSSLISLYDNHAEVLEINVSPDSKLVGIPLSALGPTLPRDFLFTVIQNRGRVMIADGSRVISPGDTVVVMTDPKHLEEIESIF